MSIYRDIEGKVCTVISDLTRHALEELHSMDRNTVIRAVRCWYWFELMAAEKAEDAGVPHELIKPEDCGLDPMGAVMFAASDLIPCEVDGVEDGPTNDIRRAIRHIISHNPDSIISMTEADIADAVIIGEREHLEAFRRRIDDMACIAYQKWIHKPNGLSDFQAHGIAAA